MTWDSPKIWKLDDQKMLTVEKLIEILKSFEPDLFVDFDCGGVAHDLLRLRETRQGSFCVFEIDPR